MDWKTAAIGGFVVLSLWGSGAAGKLLVGGVAATAAAPAVGAAAGSTAGAAAGAAASRALRRPPQGQHFPRPTTTTTAPAPEAATSAACAGGPTGMLNACPVPGAGTRASGSIVGGPPCEVTAEPRERILPDNDGDGEPDRVTRPELGCR
jgi:hypothetical protein